MAVIECVCPARPDGQTRHPDGDTVRLRDRLGFRDALSTRNSIVASQQEDARVAGFDLMATMTEAFLLVGIESWTLVDAKGKPVPVSRDAVRAFLDDHIEEAMIVGDEAITGYYDRYIAPLVDRASKSSPPTPTEDSTSPKNGSSPRPRKRSRPSSITTSQTDVTETMAASHGGGYSS